MSNHPNRSGRASPAVTPTPDRIRQARAAAGLTQTEAAALIYASENAWKQWESTVPGAARRMHPGLFELFLRKTGQFNTP